MNIIKSKRFGDVIAPESFSELLDVFQTKHQDEFYQTRFWRGQGYLEWRIDSTAYRKISNTTTSVSASEIQKTIVSYEEYLIKLAQHKGFQYDKGRELSDYEIMARLRHYGAATSLVDVSKNALFALWFACAVEAEKPGLIVGLHNNCVGGSEGQNPSGSYIEALKRSEKIDHPLLYDPPNVAARVAAQSSAFLYGAVSESSKGSIVFDSQIEHYLFIVITPELKRTSLKVISETFSINRIALFPDIEGFAQANSERYEVYGNERW